MLDPALQNWLDEARIPHEAPWAYIGTPGRVIRCSDEDLVLDVIFGGPNLGTAYHTRLVIPVAALGRAWEGYRIELIGVVKCLNLDHVVLPLAPSSQPIGPQLRILNEVGELQIDLELWRQRAYRPSGRDGDDVPQLVAEIHWWPGSEKQQPFFRDTTGDSNRLVQQAIRDAKKDSILLGQLPSRIGREKGTLMYRSRDEYILAIHRNIYDRKDRLRHLRNVAPRVIACWLSISESTIDRYKNIYGIGISDIRSGMVPKPS